MSENMLMTLTTSAIIASFVGLIAILIRLAGL
jgi:hypothetical protein